MEMKQIENIVDQYGDMVYRIALIHTRNNREDASDIFQDVFLTLIKKKMNGRKIILGGMLTSLFIEIMQVFVDRRSDVDDLILNTLGTAIGYLGYKIFVKVLFHFNWLSIKKDVNEQKDFFV